MVRTSVVICALLSAAAVVSGQNLSSINAKNAQTVYVRDSAVATDKLALAQRMEGLKEWDKSADIYQEITQKYADRVIASQTDDDGHASQYVSVALVVQAQIAKWPAEGLAVYRRRFEDIARDLLNAAPDDRAVWQKVMTQYFVTDAGRDAAMRLMSDAFERGEFSAVAWTGRRLLRLHPGLIAQRPFVLFETALADHLAGDDAAAKPWMDELQSRFPNASGTVRGVDVKLADALAKEIKNQPAIVSDFHSDDWPSAYGTLDASAVPATVSAGGAKLFSIELPMTSGRPGSRNLKQYLQRTAKDRQIGAMTGILPAVDNGDLFFQDNARVYAVDLASGLPLPGWAQTYPRDKQAAFGIDAIPIPPGKQLTVSVQGNRLIAIMGQPVLDPSIGDVLEPPQLVCLDRNSGKRNWSITMPHLTVPTDLAKLHEAAFYGTPIVTHDSVYVLVHASSGGQFEECYLLSLKLADGSFQWASYIASTSTGAMGFNFNENMMPDDGPTAQVSFADDRLYVLTNQGAVACLDASDGKTVWLNLYPHTTSPMRGRTNGFIRNRVVTLPFSINPPIITGGRVFVLPSDSPSVLVYDANTGDAVVALPRRLDQDYDPADMLLAVVGDRLVLGNRSTVFVAPWRNFNTHKSLVDNGGMYRNFTASDSNEADAIRGRPFVSEKYILIPTADKLYRMTLDQFKFESVYPSEGKWDEDESPGNVLATPDNLIIAGPSRVTAYADLAVATAKLDKRIAQNPADVEAYLHYGELLFAAGKPNDAIGRLDQAITQLGGPAKLTDSPQRARLFDILCSASTKLQRLDTPPADVLGKLFDRAKFVAQTPQEQVQYRLTQAAYDRKTGNVAAELALDQEILADATLRSAPASNGSGASTAGAAAGQAIDDLIQQHGVQIYAAYEKEAFNRLNAAKAATPPDPAALLAIADEFPASPQATDALALAGDRFEALHQPRIATQTLRRLLNRGVTNERKLVVLEALARNYLTVPNQLDTALVRLKQAKEIAADVKLTKPIALPDGQTLHDQTIGQAVAALQAYRTKVALANLPRLGIPTTNGGVPNGAAFAPAIELGAAAGVVRQQDNVARNDRVVVFTPKWDVSAYNTPSAKPCWPAVPFGEKPTDCAYSGDTLIIIGATHAMAISPEGKTLWTVTLSDLPGMEVVATNDTTDESDNPDDEADETNVPNVAAANIRARLQLQRLQLQRRMLMNRRLRGRVMANAAAPRVVNVSTDDAPQDEQISKYHLLSDRLLLGTTGGRVISIDLTTGKMGWQAHPQDQAVRHFLANEDFVAVSFTDTDQTSDVYALDAISGRVVLHNAYSPSQGALMNLALSPDGVLITMQGNRLLGRDLYDLATKQWSYDASVPTQPIDMPFVASGGDNQLIIADDYVVAVFRATNNGPFSARPFHLRTLEPLTVHNDQLNKDMMVSYASHAVNDRNNLGIAIANAGPAIYLFGPHSLAAYNLNNPNTEWHADGAAANHGLTREFFIARDYAVLVNQIANANPESKHVRALEMAIYDRTLTHSGVESGLLERYIPIRDSAGFLAEQWQLVDQGFAYVTGDQKLKLVRAKP